MSQAFDPKKNYLETKKAIGYINRKEATQADYDRIGFKSGLEVHQQLKTSKKLFCNCPSGRYHNDDCFDAEVIRHMRPTLSELGEYDGTALMEFKTKKNIIYKINNETACTYEIDDTPPFPINRDALEIALQISLLSKLNIVGEVHITRKQYLDGSIPTGFQRTAILGVEGEIELKNKKIRLIQLSIEEDSCREISDIGHWRTYKTDRLGMPLIETVTYPDFSNPDEVKEGADYIRFLNRSTGNVETGEGSTRADTNVSCRGGSRVEIKGVPSTKWMPDLTHIEAFRQYALLNIKSILEAKIPDKERWKINSVELDLNEIKFSYPPIKAAKKQGHKCIAVNLSMFEGILSHFTQPNQMFADEIINRLKVIACLEKPNMIHSEQFEPVISGKKLEKIKSKLNSKEGDAQIIFWGPEEDMQTALETIEERCIMAMEGVPEETRKSFKDGTTIFERVLPGADRMYPDTDSPPIPLPDEYIKSISKTLPVDICDRYEQLANWGIPEDANEYILKKNLIPLIERIDRELGISPKWTGIFLAHRLRNVENQSKFSKDFDYSMVFAMLRYLQENKLDLELAKKMIWELYQHPKMDFDSILTTLKFKRISKEDIEARIPFLRDKYKEIATSTDPGAETRWIMGELRKIATGNFNLAELKNECCN
ncbi:MAG: Glu-tRNA(Gln) amidotransferase subunit GatE [Bacteroidales bacterium]